MESPGQHVKVVKAPSCQLREVHACVWNLNLHLNLSLNLHLTLHLSLRLNLYLILYLNLQLVLSALSLAVN